MQRRQHLPLLLLVARGGQSFGERLVEVIQEAGVVEEGAGRDVDVGVGEGRHHEPFVRGDLDPVAVGCAGGADGDALLPRHGVLREVAPHFPDLAAYCTAV